MSRAILYVDDDAANITVFAAAFEHDLPVLTARSGAEALALMRQHEVALVLLDQRMPGMTGVELAEVIRSQYPDVVRYLITAYSDLTAAIDAINRGEVHRYLRKPWNPDLLRAELRQGLELYDSRRKVRDLERRMVEVERVYALGVVSASIAHELRNPLVVVSGHLDIAAGAIESLRGDQDDQDDSVLARLATSVGHAQRAAGAMRDILRGIETSTRRDGGTQSVDLVDVVQTTIKLVGGDVKHRTKLELELEEPLPPVRGSRTALGQVVLNLLVNALQALPRERTYDDNLLAVSLTHQGDQVVLVVDDNGPGIPAEVKARIFDPFFTTKEQGGTGLGLAISRTIVANAGGSLSASDRPGGGARFEVRLPVAGTARAVG